jgi:hypothetical protein
MKSHRWGKWEGKIQPEREFLPIREHKENMEK